jgi:hypothetical protein
MSWKLKILWILKSLLLTLISHWHQQRRLKTKLYDKLDDFTFPIVNFPFISSNIPASSAYGAYISQLIRYSRAGHQYSDFRDGPQLLTKKLFKQGCVAPKLKSSVQKCYVVITILLTVMKYPYLKWQWIFSFLRRCFLASMTHKTFTGLDCIYE